MLIWFESKTCLWPSRPTGRVKVVPDGKCCNSWPHKWGGGGDRENTNSPKEIVCEYSTTLIILITLCQATGWLMNTTTQLFVWLKGLIQYCVYTQYCISPLSQTKSCVVVFISHPVAWHRVISMISVVEYSHTISLGLLVFSLSPPPPHLCGQLLQHFPSGTTFTLPVGLLGQRQVLLSNQINIVGHNFR